MIENRRCVHAAFRVKWLMESHASLPCLSKLSYGNWRTNAGGDIVLIGDAPVTITH